MKILNDPRPWWGMLRGPERSIAELIASGTISAGGAAALWWAIEHGASMMIAAGPQGAGKTTLATSLLPFLPEDASLYVTSGPDDDLAWPEPGGPVYLLVNELSNHTPGTCMAHLRAAPSPCSATACGCSAPCTRTAPPRPLR